MTYVGTWNTYQLVRLSASTNLVTHSNVDVQSLVQICILHHCYYEGVVNRGAG